MPVLVVGSIALDHIKTPTAEHHHLLGGSASYAAVAASFFGPVRLVGVVGNDFPPEHKQLFAARQIDLEGLEVAQGDTFSWSGEYELNMNNRRTLSVALNVFEKFAPKLPESYRDTPYVLLGNIAPSLQRSVRDGEFFSTGAFPLDEIKDPTGAGDCFAGGVIGHLARTDDISFPNLKESIIQGTLVASFCVEEFSLRRMEKLQAAEIAGRRKAFGSYIA
jgi:sugar/nucleoside kinase (ribokinase family)